MRKLSMEKSKPKTIVINILYLYKEEKLLILRPEANVLTITAKERYIVIKSADAYCAICK